MDDYNISKATFGAGIHDTPMGKMNRADAPREVRMHETADKILSNRIQTAHKMVSSLEDRLEPVCRRSGEQVIGSRGGNETSSPPAIGSNTPMADVFNHLEQELSTLLERLDRLHNRIEL